MLSITQLANKINFELKMTKLTNWVDILLESGYEIDLNKFSNLVTYYKDIVYIDDNIEIIVIYWPAKSSTRIHNHPKNGCIMRVLDGLLREDVYVDNIVIETNIINGLATKEHNQFHKITNEQNYQSVSIHVYSPPNYYANK